MQSNDGFWDSIEARWHQITGLDARKRETALANVRARRENEAGMLGSGPGQEMARIGREGAEQSVERAERRSRMVEYLDSTPEHEGMFIPSKADRDFHPGSYEGNYVLEPGGHGWAVRCHHERRHVDGKPFEAMSSWLETKPGTGPAVFATKAEAVQAVHRHKLDTGNLKGGIYASETVQGEHGWTVVMERNWKLSHDRVPWSEAEQQLYRDKPGPTL